MILFYRGTSAEWAQLDPVIVSGMVGTETNTSKRKAGDGVTSWNSLPYLLGDSVTPPPPDGVFDAGSITDGASSANVFDAGTVSSVFSGS